MGLIVEISKCFSGNVPELALRVLNLGENLIALVDKGLPLLLLVSEAGRVVSFHSEESEADDGDG